MNSRLVKQILDQAGKGTTRKRSMVVSSATRGRPRRRDTLGPGEGGIRAIRTMDRSVSVDGVTGAALVPPPNIMDRRFRRPNACATSVA